MNEKGVIYPYTALFVVFILGLGLSFLNMYQSEIELYQEMQQIETLQSLVGMTILSMEENPIQSEEMTYYYNEGIVQVKQREQKEEKTLFQFNATTKTGATFRWELWYDKTNQTWNRY